jgi:hypothetical protein
VYQGRLETISYLILKQPIRFLDGLLYIVESKEKIGSKETNEYLKFDMTEVFIQEMDVALHKQLKQIALENDVKL